MLSNAPAQAEAACSYDLDECDVAWLKILNAERSAAGLGPIHEDQLERIIERFELNCWDKIQSILRNEEGLGIEYDENVICDVCRSPDSEEGNEMVFCDSCNICVHQACYGITKIPEGQWLCCTCALSQRPECVLCPNKGGAMKSTRSGQKWAHVSCALWIPEVSIGCVEKMEPITKISSIPQSRWALICVLCRERVGACIQCSVKTCKTAYHVTCAFKHGLEMRAIIEDENADDGVKLRSYCEKHSKSSKKEKSICSGSEDDDCKRKKRKDMTSEEKNQARAIRLQEIEAEFYKHVSVKDVSLQMNLNVDFEALRYIFNYWKLKRKAGNNKPLLPPKTEDVDMLSHKQEQADLEKMRMFVQLRQDLERVRNLCYMVSRREKLSRTFFRMREQTFHKQTAVLSDGHGLTNSVVQAVMEANHGPSIYDRLYSHSEVEDHTTDFDEILARIAGLNDERKPEVNGLFKDVKNNQYKNMHFNNGSTKQNSRNLCCSSTSSGEEQQRPKDNKENCLDSSDDDKVVKKSTRPRKRSNKLTERRKSRLSKTKLDSSSEEDVKPLKKDTKSRLKQIESELGESGTDSDELMTINTVQSTDSQKAKAISSIYSDSDSSDESTKNYNSKQNKLRTKAALKEFSQKPSSSTTSPEDKKKKDSSKKKDYVPTDLIVPQRQAAKKASENMKVTTSSRTKEYIQTQEDDSLPIPLLVASFISQKPSVISEEKVKTKPKIRQKEMKKETKPTVDVFNLEKDAGDAQEILAYVPQRQAAKKAAEHIKSGLGKPAVAETDATTTINKNLETTKLAKKPEPETINKSSSNSSMSSSSSTSGDSSSSSSSDSEDEKQKSKEARSESLIPTKEPAKRTTSVKDWPFLDKAVKSTRYSSSSDSSDASRSTSPIKQKPVQKRTDSTPPERRTSQTGRSPDKKRDESNKRKTTTAAARPRGRPRTTNASDRIRDTDGRPRNTSDSQRSHVERERTKKSESPEKKSVKPNKLQSPIRKTDKKLDEEVDDVVNLEKEILERKSNKESGDMKVKEKSSHKREEERVTEKVKESPVKKTPSKTKSIEYIFAKKLSSEDVTTKKPVVVNDVIVVEEEHDKVEDEKKPNLPNNSHLLEDELNDKKNSNCAFQNRSIFSPQPQPPEIIDFDMFDDGFNIPKDEEVSKAPLTFQVGNVPLFKEDSKEDSARETLNLVEKLRMEMSKKSTSYDVDDAVSVASSTKNESDKADFSEQVVPNNVVTNSVDVIPSPNIAKTYEPEVKEDDNKYVEEPPQHVGLEINKPISPVQQTNLVHAESTQGDERWVPPSENYLPVNDNYIEPAQQYLQQPLSNQDIDIQPQDSVSRNLSPNVIDPRISQTPFTDPASMDCMPSPSPYANIHPQAKWADSEVMPIRRSSSSSTASSSSCSNRNDPEDDLKRSEVMMMNHPNLEMPFVLPHQGIPPFPNSLDPFSQFPDTASPYVNPVSLFPASNINTQLPFSSPGAAMYPPSFGAPFPTVIPPLPKPIEDPIHFPSACTAAFTSSQHNMALTAAMINMPQAILKETEEPVAAPPPPPPPQPPTSEQLEVVPPSTPQITTEVQPPPVVESANNTTNLEVNHTPKSNSSVGKKSPSKPTRMSARFISQQKSPSKSPGKSPRQELQKQSVAGRGRGEGKRGGRGCSGRGGQTQTRGRGRGRGKGRSSAHNEDTIHNKLMGTVYDLDFDDDISNENVTDLKAMRERRKSTDIHERKNEISHVLKDTSQSPKFASPQSKSQKYSSDLRSLRPPTPITNLLPDDVVKNAVVEEPTPTFSDMMVQPILPGPVDMRTYNSGFEQQNYNESNLLGAFASGTAEPKLHEDIDEEFEKELQSALTSNNSSKVEDVQEPEIGNIKVSLSDSRNQLKVKIKGPIANYTSSVTSLPPPTADHNAVANITANAVSNNVMSSVAANSGTSSLRRMRKKELLRQYWTQDMNNDPGSVPINIPAAPTVSRTIITIPKAVASMTTIPTKDDYRDYRTDLDDAMESRLRKEKSRALSRELKHLDLPLDDDLGERKRHLNNSSGVYNSNLDSSSSKRRGRPPRPTTQPITPKLKIKIGNNIVGKVDEKRIRPPKKRLTTTTSSSSTATSAKPSVEDLKRESMKYRKMVMAGFCEEKKKKKDKNSKRKKRKSKPEMQIISDKEANPTKLIIRIGKKTEAESEMKRTSNSDNNNATVTNDTSLLPDKQSATNNENSGSDLSTLRIVSGNKVTPIKLKLARCQEGVGYVMKNSDQTGNSDDKEPGSGLPDPVHTPTPLPLNKDCEVR